MVKRSMLVLGNTWLLAAMSIVAMPQGAQSLIRGDIVVIGMQTAGDTAGGPGIDSFTFVTLVDLVPGTRIYFTDTGTDGSKFFGMDQNGFTGQEGLGYFEVNANHRIRAGTILSTTNTSDSFFVWKKVGADGAITTLSAGEALLDFRSDSVGDQIYAFQSTAALPPSGKPLLEASSQYHLSALGTNGSWTWSSSIPDSTTLPTILNTTQAEPYVFRSNTQQSGATYFNFGAFGPTLKAKGDWYPLFQDSANWSYSASPGFELPTGSLPVSGGLNVSWKGGSGTWDRTMTNWRDESGNITRFLPQDNVSFSGVIGGTVAVDAGGVLAKSFTINNSADSYSFTGGQIMGESLTKSGAGAAAIANAVNLTGKITVNDGTLLLSGNNSVTGTTLNGGKLVAGSNSALGTASIVFNGGTLASDNDSRVLANPLTVNNVAGNKVGGEHSLALTGGASGPGTLQVAFDSSSNALKVSGAVFAPAKIDVHEGSLLLGASNVLGDSTRIQLSGGTLATDGFSETVGALTLTYDSMIDLGSGSSVLRFANSRNETWSGTLRIDNWSGSGSGTDRLLFGSSFTNEANAGLTAGQLGRIYFNNPEGFAAGHYSAILGPDGELRPDEQITVVPEPSTFLTGLACVGFLGFHRRRSRN